jgi:hypothetical protein
VWPFSHKAPASPDKDPVIPDRLHAMPSPTHPAPGETVMDELREVQSTLIKLWRPDKSVLDELVTASASLVNLLDSVLGEMRRGQRSLDRFTGSVDAAAKRIQSVLGSPPDVVVRRFTVGRKLRWPALLAYDGGMVDSSVIDRDIIRLLELYDLNEQDGVSAAEIHDRVQYSAQAIGHVTTTRQWSQIFSQLASGSAILLVEGTGQALVLDASKRPSLPIGPSASEPSIKGPQESFSDVTITQLAQIRQRLRSPQLRFDSVTVGSLSNTTIVVAYMDGVTNPELVSVIKSRVQSIQRDTVQRVSEIVSYLTNLHSLFPLVRITDRVDWAVRDLANGKILIVVDNDPFVGSLPCVLLDFYQTSQDYVFSPWEGSLVRIVRLLGLALALYLLPLYIALSSVNPDLMPTRLLLTVQAARLGMPIPPVMEVIIMWIIIEVLREAANRLPKELATTLGTVGAVVVGTAIVKAGIVSDIVIVATTLTALGLFTTPTFEMTAAWRWLFWVMVLGSYMLGILGMVLVTVFIITYLAALEPFGVPYLSPFGPIRLRDLKDSVLRAPITALKQRPFYLRPADIQKEVPPPDWPSLDPVLDSGQKESHS